MWETRPVELRLRLPHAMAAELEEVQRREPEVINWIVQYGLTRRLVFQALMAERERQAERT